MSILRHKISYRVASDVEFPAVYRKLPERRGYPEFSFICRVGTWRLFGLPILSTEKIVVSRLTDLGEKL
jgi:hypothetical protein